MQSSGPCSVVDHVPILPQVRFGKGLVGVRVRP